MQQMALLLDLDGKLDDALILGALRAVAESQRLLTVDDVWNRIGIIPADRKEASRIGPVMQEAERQGIISSTDQFLRSRRVRAHGNLMKVWKSEIY